MDEATGLLPRDGEPIREEHLVCALKLMAYVVVRHGEKYTPVFESFERDLADLRRQRSPRDRANMILQSYTVEGGVNAIR